MRSLIILGSTGSVGTQALDVVRRNPERFRVVGLSSATSHDLLVGQIREFMPPLVAVADEDAAIELKEKLEGLRQVEVLVGPDAARILAREAEADVDEPDLESPLLSFELAARVDFGPELKQELLELRSERMRLRRVIELIERVLRAMALERELGERAAGNGKVGPGGT
jgi:hypothetical protein